MTDICIDISHWQGFPDFEEVAASGVLGVIHKATEGTSYVDPNRSENLSAAVKAGLSIATYFWLKPGNAYAQANFYLDTVRPVQGERVIIDYEEDGCDLDDLHNAVQGLLDANCNLQITVYSGHLLKDQLGDAEHDPFLYDNTDLWLAQYTTGQPTWPAGTYPEWALWQYSENGTIPGIDDCYVDLNRFNGSDIEFLGWINPAGTPIPDPRPPRPPRREVTVEITSPDGVFVSVVVNGKTIRYRPRPHRRHIKRWPDILR